MATDGHFAPSQLAGTIGSRKVLLHPPSNDIART